MTRCYLVLLAGLRGCSPESEASGASDDTPTGITGGEQSEDEGPGPPGVDATGSTSAGSKECDTMGLNGPAAALACLTDCEAKTNDVNADAVCIHRVTGLLIDGEGEPVPEFGVSVCGEVCYGGATNEKGRFSIPVFNWLVPSRYSISPHGSPHFTSFYYQLRADFVGGGNYDGGTIRVLDLPTSGRLLTTKSDLADREDPPEQSVNSAGIALEIGAGTLVSVTVSDALDGDEGRRFRVLEVENQFHDEFAAHLPTEARLFALGPFDASLKHVDQGTDPSVSIRFDNTSGWAAGATINVEALGTYFDEDWVSPHTFAPIGSAIVSSDGQTIVLLSDSPGLGLRHLTWLALVP